MRIIKTNEGESLTENPFLRHVVRHVVRRFEPGAAWREATALPRESELKLQQNVGCNFLPSVIISRLNKNTDATEYCVQVYTKLKGFHKCSAVKA